MPKEFTTLKKLGKGAYGKVMHVRHEPTGREYACKRFENVFGDEQRCRRLIRELKILNTLQHPCCNKLKCIVAPSWLESDPDSDDSISGNSQNKFVEDQYLVLRKCDMDLKKLLKMNKFLDET